MTDQEKMFEAAKQSMKTNAALYEKLAEMERAEKEQEGKQEDRDA